MQNRQRSYYLTEWLPSSIMIQLMRRSSSHTDDTTVEVDSRSAADKERGGERVSSLAVPMSSAAVPGGDFAFGPVRQGSVASDLELHTSIAFDSGE